VGLRITARLHLSHAWLLPAAVHIMKIEGGSNAVVFCVPEITHIRDHAWVDRLTHTLTYYSFFLLNP
jgi:hypothetical protein